MRRRFALFVLIGAVALIVIGCRPSAPTQPPAITLIPTSEVPATPVPTASSGLPPWLTVYFTNPNPPDQVGKGFDQIVIPFLKDAKRSIDLASFDLNLASIVTELIKAQDRGVEVRIIVDDKNGNNEFASRDKVYKALDELRNHKIPVVSGGRSNGLMHNKMIIIDGVVMFIGSWNMSYNDTFRNDNNILKITSQRLIANYQAKFEEGFLDRRFGARAEVGARSPHMTLDNVQVDNYFSTSDKVMEKLVAEVNSAQRSIRFMAFTYTHNDLEAAMLGRARAGVIVEGVYENRGASQGTMPDLFCAGLPVKVDGNKYTMHHKVIIIDEQTVITGSYNFTKSADESNDDNVIIIRSPAVAALYMAEFARVYGLGKQPDKVECK